MSDEDMAHSKSLSLLEEWEKAQAEARKNPCSKEYAIPIPADKFSQVELANPPEKVKFHIAFGQVYFKPCPNPLMPEGKV